MRCDATKVERDRILNMENDGTSLFVCFMSLQKFRLDEGLGWFAEIPILAGYPIVEVILVLAMGSLYMRRLSLYSYCTQQNNVSSFESLFRSGWNCDQVRFGVDSQVQQSARPQVRGKATTSRTLLTPVKYASSRSKPNPYPP